MLIMIIIITIIMIIIIIMIMIIIMIIIITIIILEIRDFLQSLHCVANCLQHVRSSGLGAIMCKSCTTHWALIKCNILCATWYKGTAQL